MKFEKKDFEKLLFNVYSLPPKTRITEHFTKLAYYDEFNIAFKDLDKDVVIRYIIYVYDKNSPFLRIDNLAKRKREAALLAGFTPKKDGTFDDEIRNVLHCRNRDVNKMIVRFCRMCKDPLYAYYVVINEAFFKESENIMCGDKTKIKELKDLRESIEELISTRREFLSQEESMDLHEELEEFIELEELELRPEDIALKLQKGINPIVLK